VSKVFHWHPQSQDQRSSLRGDQPQSGQRMRGPDSPEVFSSRVSGSMTVADLPLPAKSGMARSLACPGEAAAGSIERVSGIENFDRWLLGTSPQALGIREPGGDWRPRLLVLNIGLTWLYANRVSGDSSFRASHVYRHPSRAGLCSPSSAGCRPPTQNGIHPRSRE